MTIPSQYYQELIRSGQIEANHEQQHLLPKLDNIYHNINALKNNPIQTKLKWILMPNSRPKGLYLWGDVGIGKTLLIDCLCRCLPPDLRLRTHFHQFMTQIHQQLHELKHKNNPLDVIADTIAQKTRLLALDEFLVRDISNAMILDSILRALHKRRVFIITTANLAPDDLYKGGLQRQRFLPTIAWLKEKLSICHLTQQKDYRQLKQAKTPIKNMHTLPALFKQYSYGLDVSTDPLIIYQRPINIIAQAGDIIWLNFIDLCNIPRSHQDYLTLSEQFKIMLIDQITPIKENQHHLITNFIKLIDVLYDQKVQIYLDSTTPLSAIYPQGRFEKPFKRTLSRLREMTLK